MVGSRKRPRWWTGTGVGSKVWMAVIMGKTELFVLREGNYIRACPNLSGGWGQGRLAGK